jgi:Family of unknown function (DUF6188)
VVITESADGYDVDLKGHKVMQCVVDFAFTLELERMGQRTTVRVEGPFVLSQGDETHELDAEARPRELGPALELSRTSVRSGVVHKTGGLELTFDDGAVLRVPSEPKYEAWTLTVTDGPMIICGPGGKLTFFRSPVNPDSPSD